LLPRSGCLACVVFCCIVLSNSKSHCCFIMWFIP
jgi:hypothetical protein